MWRVLSKLRNQKTALRDKQGRLVYTKETLDCRFSTEDIIYCDVPIGRMTYGFARIAPHSLSGISSIGRYGSLADSLSVAGITHPLNWVSTNPFLYKSNRGLINEPMTLPQDLRQQNKPITIGHDVWIGEGVRILRSVTLGHGCAVGAGAVVTKDVPPYAIVAGVPAKIIRYRITEDLIPKMLNIAWWDWPIDKIRKHIADFYCPDNFINKHSTDS